MQARTKNPEQYQYRSSDEANMTANLTETVLMYFHPGLQHWSFTECRNLSSVAFWSIHAQNMVLSQNG